MYTVPFALRRPFLLARDVMVDRDRPDLRRLSDISDPEHFVWAILPHAARTFSACIALLPGRAARVAAVAYLYCRMLDTYEDLLEAASEREEALRSFGERFGASVRGPRASKAGSSATVPDGPRAAAGAVGTAAPASGAARAKAAGLLAAPRIAEGRGRDLRDATHLLLVERHALVDRVYLTLAQRERELIQTLVHDMSEGMRWSSATFHRQSGVLENEAQLARYCRNVLGHPVRFASRLLRLCQVGDAGLPEQVGRDAMTVGEMVQLANVTRDIEKDLRRGIAYHPLLKEDLGRSVDGDADLVERVRVVREQLLLMALRRAPAYRRLVEFVSPRPLSLARASAVLMMLFTDRYFRSCARRAGRAVWGGRRAGVRLILEALPAACSRRWARRVLCGIEQDFLRAAALA
ncbi:MAG: squalene/phytoene synthase family protein [Acidobacteriota bacterium]